MSKAPGSGAVEVARSSPDRPLMHGEAVPSDWPDLAGRLVARERGQAHVLPVRVYFEDTDFSGLVYHASYVRWCERGRSDFLRLLGSAHRALIDGAGGEKAAFVVRRLNLEYLKPARIDDVLEVTTEVRAMSAATLVLAQTVSRAGELLCEAEVTVVLVSVSGRVLRLSAALKASLAGKD
ncbi:MAG: YbgC/FadM family acyl-CoA thioesterase [Hyphomicrobiaceae bacterium]